MRRLIGWLAIAMALFALAPSMVPGAFSVFGLLMALLALILSLFSIKQHGHRYFRVTAVIVVAGVLLVNDALRIWQPLPLPLSIKIGLYGVALFVIGLCSAVAYRLAHPQSGPHKTGAASSTGSLR